MNKDEERMQGRKLGKQYRNGPSPQKAQIRHTVKLAGQLRNALSQACPKLPQKVLTSLAVDLADMHEIGVAHSRYLKRFLTMHFPEDLVEAESLLIDWIEVQLLFHNRWHLNSLRREFPKLLRVISRESESKLASRNARANVKRRRG